MKGELLSYSSYLENYFEPNLKEGKNPHSVATLRKLSISSCNIQIGKSKEYRKELTEILTKITLQQPMTAAVRRSISQFKIRKGNLIALRVTLRKERMWSFIDRLICVNLPRVRQFKGLSNKAMSRDGNYTMGISDHTVFYETQTGKQVRPYGFSVVFDTTARNPEECKRLLSSTGLVFAK
jgi:large subunit ribosomal protein L5